MGYVCHSWRRDDGLKVSIIGKGTAGCMTAAWCRRWINADEIDWYFDPSIKPQAVGEGSTLNLPRRLNESLNFSPRDFDSIGATTKTGIYKESWGSKRKSFIHDFPSPSTALHFDATLLQDYVYNKLKDVVSIKEANVSSDDIDADYIIDCSGRPSSFEDFEMSRYIPVNSVYVTQCSWDYPRFSHTLAIARPYGWVFGIPLKNRCSIGYMYNKDINTLEEVKADVEFILDEYALVPNGNTNSFSFYNYRRKNNFKDNIVYNGNASFFLEPLEATSFATVDNVNTMAIRKWFENSSLELSNTRYHANLDACENIIMLHYASGSSFKSDFWSYAKERGIKCLENADPSLKYMLENSKEPNSVGSYSDSFKKPSKITHHFEALYQNWWEGSFSQNKIGLGLCQ